jgi:uncharacterized protein YlxW (UPF0749 family)
MSSRLAQLSLFAVALFIGALLVGQLRSQARPIELSSLSAQELSALIETLSAANVDLSDAAAARREQIRDYELAEIQGQSALDLTREDLEEIAAFAGLRPVEGQGISILLEGSYDTVAINDLVHELRNAGAEAISVGGARITAGSVAQTGTPEIEIDGVPLEGTVEILAIGSPQGLRAALERPGGYLAFLEQYIDARVTITTSQDITVPATERNLTPTATRPVE